jgi:hypothetical protein
MAEEVCRAALRKCRYNGRIFLEMVGQSEGVRAAKNVPAASAPQYGFTELWERGGLCFAILMASRTASAATIKVERLCSLQAAIDNYNARKQLLNFCGAGTGDDTIILPTARLTLWSPCRPSALESSRSQTKAAIALNWHHREQGWNHPYFSKFGLDDIDRTAIVIDPTARQRDVSVSQRSALEIHRAIAPITASGFSILRGPWRSRPATTK